MKKHLLPVLLLAALCGISQPAVKWQKSLGGSAADRANAVATATDGGFVVAGESLSNSGDLTANYGNADYWVARIDSLGALVWQKNLGGTSDDRANAVAATADGGFIVAGMSSSPVGNDITAVKGLNDFWIVKLSSTGAISWQKNMGGTGYDEARAIQQTSDGGYIIAGESRSNNYDLTGNQGLNDFWIVKTDNAGVIQWQKNLGGSADDMAYSVQQTSDGGYIVAGQSKSNNGNVTGNNGNFDFWVVKLDASGSLTWQKSLGGSGNDYAYSVKQTGDGGYIVAGKTDSNNNGQVGANNGAENAWIVKLTSAGNLSWQDCYGGIGLDGANSILTTSDGGYLFAGVASSNNADVSGNKGLFDFWVVKLNSTGVIGWQKCLGGTSNDVAMSVQPTLDNGYVVAGRSISNNMDITNAKGQDDFWVVRFVGTPTPIGIREMEGNSSLISVYPNPGAGIFTISSSASLQGSQLKVMNAAGQIVHNVTLSESGFSIDLSGAAKGLYLLQISDASGTITGLKKLVVE
jgi:hypothetical protein